MTYTPGLNGGRINASIGGNSTSAGGGYSLISTGTMLLAGGNNVTLSQNASVISINAANQTNPAVSGANGSSTFQTLSMANSNGVSFSTGTQGLYATVQTNYLTTARASTDAIGLNTAESNVTWTANSSGLSLDARGYAGTGTTFNGANVSGSITQNSNGLNLSLSAGGGGAAGSNTFGISNLGNTAGNSGVISGSAEQLLFAGGNNVTLSQATAAGAATITINAQSQSVQSLSLSVVNHTTGNTAALTIDARSLVLDGLGGATVGLSTSVGGSSIVISAPLASAQTQSLIAGMYDGVNSISTGTVMLSDANGVSFGINGQTITASVAAGGNDGYNSMEFTNSTANSTMPILWAGNSNGSGNITMGLTGSTVTASAAGGGGAATISHFDPVPKGQGSNTSAFGQNSLYFVPFDLFSPINVYRLNLFLSISGSVSAVNSTASGGNTISAALYSQGTGASTSQIGSFWSGSAFFNYNYSSNSQIKISYPVGISNSTAVSSTGYTSNATNASTQLITNINGLRVLPLPVSSTLTEGRYWLAMARSSVTANIVGNSIGISNFGVSWTNVAFENLGQASSASNAGFWDDLIGLGTYSTTSGAFPANVPIVSDTIRNQTNAFYPTFNLAGFTTGTNFL